MKSTSEPMFSATDLAKRCHRAIGQPLQRGLRRLGFPEEKQGGGGLFAGILCAVASHARPDSHTPTGFSVDSDVILSFGQFRQLEKELGRMLCNSGDVIFGSIQIGAFDENEALDEDDCSYIDLRPTITECLQISRPPPDFPQTTAP